MLIQIDSPASADRIPVVFRAGFRPFFLLAGVQAAVMVPVWLAQYLTGWDLDLAYSPTLWHGHEMVFGFATAALAGFLLTAVPNWTGSRGVKGAPLAFLTFLWLAARLCFWVGGLLPPWVGAIFDLPFLPILAALLARPLISAAKWRNIAFLPILGILTLADALVLAEMVGIGELGRTGLYLGVFVLILMVTIIGGRIIPAFTASGMRQVGVLVQPRQSAKLDNAVIASMLAAAVAIVALPGTMVAGALALVASVLQGVRLVGWKGWRTASVPLLWVLHLGYLWLVIGLGLLGLSSFVPGLRPETALHGLTVGCIAMMIVGVMSRAALGHAGRPLVPAKPTVAAYGLIFIAAFVRVFGVMLDQPLALWISGALWTLGFLLYVIMYAPVCLLPRADGRPS